LSWAEQELHRLRSERPEHQPLLARLRDSLNEVQLLLGQLQAITLVGHPRLIPKALRTIHQIEYWVVIITSYYIPALQREGKDDLALRELLLPTAVRCGLSWIEDIAVRLDGQHATVSVLTETPVVFAPPQHSVSLLDMAGLYHELGHTVFHRFPVIAEDLSDGAMDYYFDFSQKAGPMSPSKRAERDRAINEALEYWDEKRLEEIFCDVYATFVSGPVHYFSCVDMAVRGIRDPFHVDIRDVHPPLAARVCVCDKALASSHRRDRIVRTTRNTWRTHTNLLMRNAEFELICPDELLECLTDTAIQGIRKFLPDADRYDRPPTAIDDANPTCQGMSLEDILNAAVRILLSSPSQYAVWEQKVIETLMPQSVESPV